MPASLNTAQTKPEQSYRFGPVEPYRYGIPNFEKIDRCMLFVVVLSKIDRDATMAVIAELDETVFFTSDSDSTGRATWISWVNGGLTVVGRD